MGLPALVLACLAGVAGCGEAPAGAAASARPLPPPASFAISYQRSGGLAASSSRLVVRPGRRAVAETSGGRAGQRRVAFRIGRRRVLTLERGLRRAGFASLQSPGPGNCADCFEYEVRYRGHAVAIDDSQLSPRLGAVVGQLEAVVAAHAIPPNA